VFLQTKAKQIISTLKLFNTSSQKASLAIGCFVVLAFGITLGFILHNSPKANAATGINEQLNYQARLLDSTGAVVADGTYNMEFKIYQDGTGCVSSGSPPCGGTLKWTETRTSTNKVTVRNGYFSVNLGSVTAFSTSVDWNQDTLWLSINIGGTGTPSWDGEMTPFRRLAAVPYAMNTKQLGGLNASLFVQLAPSAVQVDSGTLASIFINKTGGSGNILELQNNGTDVASVGNTGAVIFQNSTNSASGFAIKDQGTQVLFKADTSARGAGGGNLIKIGDSTGTDTATTILQLDGASAVPTSNLSALNGGMFYNSNTNKVSIIENGVVKVVCNTTDAGCGAGGSGANTALSNLASVAINTSLLPGLTTIDLGSTTAAFRDLYLGGSATNYIKFSGTSTTGRTVTLSDNSGTMALLSPTSQQSGNLNISGTVTSGTVNSQTISSAANFTGTITAASDITINAQGDLHLADADSSNWVAFQAPSTVGTNVTWTLPNADSAGCFQSNGSGTVSIAACGDTNSQTFSANGDYTLPTNALMVVVEAGGGGGGGGGGTGGSTAAVRSGGAGGGGGAYSTTIITGSSIGTAGTVVKVTVGGGGTAGTAGNGAVGGDGGAGGATCFSTVTACSGSLYLQTFGGGGGNADGAAGNGGGGGGGSLSVGATNATAATGGTGGSPLGAAAGAMNSGFGGAGGATAATGAAAGGSAGYGGGGGGASTTAGGAASGAGGGATQGGAGGGAGGTCAITTCTLRAGGAGGHVPGLSGGGGTAGSTSGQAGGVGAGGVGSGGDGGGGGATNAAGTGGAGGAGGARGGGGGGGGAGETTLGGAGGLGGAGYLRTWTLRGAGADLAEMYNTFDNDMIAGDVVAIDGSLQSGVKKTQGSYDHNTMGVVSTKPGLVLGDETNGQGAKTVMVALAGRVPVKVSLENGPIKIGDPLTPSSTPGVAMKATKYGPIIGQAMTGYSGDGPGYVVVFIKNSHANGSKISDALQSASAKYQDPQKSLAQNALSFFSEDGKVQPDSANVSEIYTDRVTAAIEVISPNVTTNNLSTDSISSTTGTEIKTNLKTNGKFSINNTANSEVASIDDAGNANFKGTITADKIRANQIEGLEILTNKISSLAEAQQSQKETATGTTTDPTSDTSQAINLKDITAQTAVFSSDLTTSGTLFANGALKVAGPAEFLGDSIFYKLATFIDKTVFKNNVSFEAPAVFGDKIIVSNNTAGSVKIPIGATKVIVQFSKPYTTPPIINATPIGIIAPKYGVTNITKDGFEIDIDPAQPTDTQFNWFAVEAQP
jgi:hypothetical protein